VVELVHAVGGAGLHQLRGACRPRQAPADRLGALQRQVQVFLMQGDSETPG